MQITLLLSSVPSANGLWEETRVTGKKPTHADWSQTQNPLLSCDRANFCTVTLSASLHLNI